ncbi:MAG: NAD(P)-dependent oxidoreductase [Clostridia bacterium]|nr:NAD(P)-dependent oxidoreductase [Clostridia bacterium]
MRISITGATGNVGREALKEIVKAFPESELAILVFPGDKRLKFIKKTLKRSKAKLIFGSLADAEACAETVKGADYVIDMAAVIPPLADKNPRAAEECNVTGVKRLLRAIEAEEKQPKLIHISSMAVYGNRNLRHPWGRVGDPLLVSPFDFYAATKLRGEFAVLESSVKKWAVLRQTAVLHERMLADNLSDGLIFHTCFNSPLEWVTANDSGVLIANIIKKDAEKDLGNVFWRKVFNIGGPRENCVTGYEFLSGGFDLIGGSAKDFFKPDYNALRNFHGLWFADGHVLDDMFRYQKTTVSDYWKEIGKKRKYYSLAKILPKKIVAKLAIERLFKDSNSVKFWYNNKDEARITAYFGGFDAYEKIPKNWEDFPLNSENRSDWGDIDYAAARNVKNASFPYCGYDYAKRDEDIDINDLRSVARMHGGELKSETFEKGDLYKKLTWQTQDGEEFIATPYTVLRAGHWYNCIYYKNAWDFDRLSKKDKIFASIWLDSHSANENYRYEYDGDFNAKVIKEK